MYNAEQKEQFLNTIVKDNSYRSYESAFNKSERYENLMEKDVADMTLQEVILLLDSIAGKSAQSIANCRSLLSNYVDWCIRNGKSIFTENNFSKFSYTLIDKQQTFRTDYVGSEEELREMIKIAFPKNYDYNQEIYEMREAILWLTFYGLDCDEIRSLKKTDIDAENLIVKSPLYENIIYKFDKDFIDMLERICEIKEIEYAVNGRSPRTEKLCDNEYVFRPKIGRYRNPNYSGTITKLYVWKRFSQLNEFYENETGIYKKLSVITVRRSKFFIDYFNCGESDQFIDSLKTDIIMRSPSKNERQIYVAILNFKRDYQAWKKAFK